MRCLLTQNATNLRNRQCRSISAKRVEILISENSAQFYNQCKLGSCKRVNFKFPKAEILCFSISSDFDPANDELEMGDANTCEL